jgi:hypothetical protein
VERLEHDRRAAFELLEDPVDVGRPGERRRPPAEVDGVVADLDPLALLDETEGRVADPRRADEPLDIRLREEAVEARRLAARDDERLSLPMLGEELLGRDRLDRLS